MYDRTWKYNIKIFQNHETVIWLISLLCGMNSSSKPVFQRANKNKAKKKGRDGSLNLREYLLMP